MLHVNSNIRAISVSPASMMTAKARELTGRGVKVVSLSTGEPDFDTPEHVVEAAVRAARSGNTHYPPLDGVMSLKEAVQRKFQRDNRLGYALNEIMVANGAKQIIFNALMATLEPGDEVIVPVPAYASYADMTRSVGGVPVTVTCGQNNGFRLRPEDLEAAIGPRTRWVILNFPNNPTGTVYSREHLQEIAAVVLRHPDVWVLTDDIYEHLTYADVPFRTIAEVEPQLKDRVLTVNGCSKAYAMTGWRVGFCGGPRPLIEQMLKVQSQVSSGICTISQAAAVAALDGPQEILEQWRQVYRERRDLVVGMLSQVPQLSCHRPDGAFYAFPNVAGCLGRTTAGGARLQTDADVSLALLAEQHVSTVHGAAFGPSGYIRLSYATDMDSLRIACERIQAFCASLR
ncbi:pyridoxal phosphate-dependent aminotransferase [Reyranella sp.]|uniref:pyridoxal phosphate-dependent aminotransferase n=1 Tax=Reyranella sp. TaxID=1929291 RepID=UPI003784FD0C